jgi:hypothetical protein
MADIIANAMKENVEAATEGNGETMRHHGKLTLTIVFLQLIFCIKQNNVLLKQEREIFGLLPSQMVSVKNPISMQKTVLGKALFYETRISTDGNP